MARMVAERIGVLLKAFLPMEVTENGISILVNLLSAKALLPIATRVFGNSIAAISDDEKIFSGITVLKLNVILQASDVPAVTRL